MSEYQTSEDWENHIHNTGLDLPPEYTIQKTLARLAIDPLDEMLAALKELDKPPDPDYD